MTTAKRAYGAWGVVVGIAFGLGFGWATGSWLLGIGIGILFAIPIAYGMAMYAGRGDTPQ